MDTSPSRKPGWFVYVLRNKNGTKVYTGCTKHPIHRMRQHRGEIKGGAVTTRNWGPNEASMFILVGLFTEREAKKFEYAMKHGTIPRRNGGGMRGRVATLAELLSSKKHFNRKGHVTVMFEYDQEKFLDYASHSKNKKKKKNTTFEDAGRDIVLPDNVKFEFNCGENMGLIK